MRKLLTAGLLVLAAIYSGCTPLDDVAVDSQATSGRDTQTADSGSSATTSTPRTVSGGDTTSTTGRSTQGGDHSLYSVYFGFDRFIIEGSRNIDTIKSNAALIISAGNNVRVEGNTDEWGSDEYNYALALKRASSVKDALVGNGVPAEKIDLISYGESKPLCTEKTSACWRENRRVDFVLVR